MATSSKPKGTPAPGSSIALREYRRGKGISLDVDPRIDLTRPIYEQVIKLSAQDKRQKRKSAEAS